jgi:hypothetical protein
MNTVKLQYCDPVWVSVLKPRILVSSILVFNTVGNPNWTLSNRNFIMKMEKPKNLGFEPVHPKNVLLASVVYEISCLLTISNNIAGQQKFFFDRIQLNSFLLSKRGSRIICPFQKSVPGNWSSNRMSSP